MLPTRNPDGTPSSRVDKILFGIDRGAKVLEVGPSFSPIVPRSAGWNSYSLDHLSADELRRKYEGHPVDASRIEAVDFVWKDGPIDASVPPEHHGTFDACVASHVVEHAPDLIGFFAAIRTLLKSTGVLSLAIPDKRYSFDYFLPLTMTGDVLEARAARRTRHPKKAAFNATAYAAKVDEQIAWAPGPLGKLALVSTLAAAHSAFDSHAEGAEGAYSDMHGMCFTPASFELVILELAELGSIDFRVRHTFPTAGCEFFVALVPGAVRIESEAELTARRLELLKRTLVEQREQADRLVESVGREP